MLLAGLVALSPLSLPMHAQPLGATRGESFGRTVIDATFAGTFEQLRSVRELPDGRVLVTDGGSLPNRAVFLLGPDGRLRKQLGRHGEGPGEYRSPATLFALGGSETLLIDGQTGRWHQLHDDRFVDMHLETHAPRLSATGQPPAGIDSVGRALQLHGRKTRADFPTQRVTRPEYPAYNEIIDVRLYAPNGTFAVVATVSGRFLGVTDVTKRPTGGEMRWVGLMNPLQTHDQAVLFGDGAIAILYVDPYRVDWRSADGRWTRGAPIAFTKVPVSNVMKQLAAQGYQRDYIDGKPLFDVQDFPPFPPTVPPFRLDALTAGTDGRLYVLRSVLDRRDDPRYVDVFDRTGVRLHSVALPPRARLVGAGVRGVYLAIMNDDDEEQLVRAQILR
jgi:hypothetical protein